MRATAENEADTMWVVSYFSQNGEMTSESQGTCDCDKNLPNSCNFIALAGMIAAVRLKGQG